VTKVIVLLDKLSRPSVLATGNALQRSCTCGNLPAIKQSRHQRSASILLHSPLMHVADSVELTLKEIVLHYYWNVHFLGQQTSAKCIRGRSENLLLADNSQSRGLILKLSDLLTS